ncbi:MAG: hypothetical protein DRG11_04780 [Epsilonproteobacteria bacterium]|nr:MAG: hypothetical protein DRG11_04780 [Campylobacterota bacterium]
MIFKIVLILILSITANSRLNPFEPTDLFDDIKIEDDIVSADLKQNDTININKYIKVSIFENKLTIDTNKYKLKKSIIFEDIGKIMIDFKAKVRFKSKTVSVSHKSIDKISVGSHYEENLFRVVIRMNKNTKKYKIIKSKNLTTIRF